MCLLPYPTFTLGLLQVAQEIDFFGEIAGTAFSPCGGGFFVTIADQQYGSLMSFERVSPQANDRYLPEVPLD